MQVAIATTRIKLRIFPTPRYIKRRKNSTAIVARTPRLLFAKINENVKRRQKNTITKRRGTTPNIPGSIK